jgi:hypothetical protein
VAEVLAVEAGAIMKRLKERSMLELRWKGTSWRLIPRFSFVFPPCGDEPFFPIFTCRLSIPKPPRIKYTPQTFIINNKQEKKKTNPKRVYVCYVKIYREVAVEAQSTGIIGSFPLAGVTIPNWTISAESRHP